MNSNSIIVHTLFLCLFFILSKAYPALLSEHDDNACSSVVVHRLEQIKELSPCFQVLEEQIALAKTKENILVIGESKAGKSTLIACFLGQPAQAIAQDDGELMLSIANPLSPSITKVSTPWFDTWYKSEESRVYWEFREILNFKELDSHDYYHNGWEWVALQRVLQHLPVKVMIVAPYTSGRYSHPKLYNMLSLVTEFFPLGDLKEISHLVVTKIDPEINLIIHLRDISQSIVANTTLVSNNGKNLLAYWVEQGEQRTISFFSPTNEGKIDGYAIKTQLNHNLQNLASKQLAVLPFMEDRSPLLPDSQIRAKKVYHFWNESAVRVVHDFCQNLLSFLQEGIETQSLLNLTSYWQSFTEEIPTLKSRESDDLRKFLSFVDNASQTPQLLLKEWEEVFGAEGEVIKETLVLLEILRRFQGFEDIRRILLRQIIDKNSRLIIKDMDHDFKEDIRRELIRCKYLNSIQMTQNSSPSSPLPQVYLLPVEKSVLYERTEMKSEESSKETKLLSPTVASGNTAQIASGNQVGANNTFSVGSPTLHVEKPLGDQPCKDCCDGLINLLSCCFSREKPAKQEGK